MTCDCDSLRIAQRLAIGETQCEELVNVTVATFRFGDEEDSSLLGRILLRKHNIGSAGDSDLGRKVHTLGRADFGVKLIARNGLAQQSGTRMPQRFRRFLPTWLG